MDFNTKSIILLADDDAEDRMLVTEALEEANAGCTIKFVEDGEELMDYLLHRGKFSQKEEFPAPNIILLDLNMPRKDGREALIEIKSHEHLRCIPVVVLTTSKAEEDILKTYSLGVSSFITKPASFTSLVDTMATLCKYWFGTVKLPLSLSCYSII
ncbi:response regulator [Pontibacter diazotrophicus]|uniref:Response regulator n=1 Tax=Pontibacter diazotrophicus TaxID=1400979 RepID=A0A3D8L8C0_9BACT|nr:response regulator [Pontibacter diazotrophicus]RDV13546.1 response regulator [Pontibacter diazotrophicus]